MGISVDIINFMKNLKLSHEAIISNQNGRRGTRIGSNIYEVHMHEASAALKSRKNAILRLPIIQQTHDEGNCLSDNKITIAV